MVIRDLVMHQPANQVLYEGFFLILALVFILPLAFRQVTWTGGRDLVILGVQRLALQPGLALLILVIVLTSIFGASIAIPRVLF